MVRSARGPGDRSPADRRFLLLLAAITAGGFLIRIALSLLRPDPGLISDATYFRVQGELLAAGHGFAQPFTYLQTGRIVPTAFHPPLLSVVAAMPNWVGLYGVTTERVVTSLAGAVTIAAVGLTARIVGGRRVGLIAAGLAAISPNLWAPDTNLNAEGLAACLVALALLAAYRLAARPRALTAVGLGLVLGLGALARPEALVLAPFLLLPALRAPGTELRRRIGLAALTLVVTAVTVAPWVVRSMTTFEHPVPFSTNGVAVVGFANCPTVYDGAARGSWFIGCPTENARVYPGSPPARGDETEVARVDADLGVHYLRDHVGELPAVLAARLGRTWSLYQPLDLQAARGDEGKLRWEMLLGVAMLWVSLPLAVLGGVELRRRRTHSLLPLLGPIVVASIVTLAAYGTPRFRVIAEPSIAILAAVGIGRLVRRRVPVPAEPDST